MAAARTAVAGCRLPMTELAANNGNLPLLTEGAREVLARGGLAALADMLFCTSVPAGHPPDATVAATDLILAHYVCGIASRCGIAAAVEGPSGSGGGLAALPIGRRGDDCDLGGKHEQGRGTGEPAGADGPAGSTPDADRWHVASAAPLSPQQAALLWVRLRVMLDWIRSGEAQARLRMDSGLGFCAGMPAAQRQGLLTVPEGFACNSADLAVCRALKQLNACASCGALGESLSVCECPACVDSRPSGSGSSAAKAAAGQAAPSAQRAHAPDAPWFCGSSLCRAAFTHGCRTVTPSRGGDAPIACFLIPPSLELLVPRGSNEP